MLTTLLLIMQLSRPGDPGEFDSMNEAAVKVLQMAYNWTPAYERGGVITKLASGKYAVSIPKTNWGGDHVEVNEDPDLYRGTIVATYHTHPCLPDSHYPGMFSPDDLSLSRTTGHPTYIADLCTGDVHRWQPGDKYDHVEDASILFDPRVAIGTIVGHIAVSGVPLEPLPKASK